MSVACTKFFLSRSSQVRYFRNSRYYASIKRSYDVRSGLAYHDKKVVRTIDGTEIDQRVSAVQLIYCDYMQNHQRIFSYAKRMCALKAYLYKTQKKKLALESKQTQQPSVSVLLDKLYTEEKAGAKLRVDGSQREQWKCDGRALYMPYSCTERRLEDSKRNGPTDNWRSSYNKLVRRNSRVLHKHGIHFKDYHDGNESEIPRDWMTDYEEFNDSILRDDVPDLYGTAIPDSEISKVACIGCGALLHCKDHGIPGYLPSEIFGGLDKANLRSVICQRCHFLKHYNTALDVQVSPKDYEEMLSKLKDVVCAIVLIVDMTDIPCSIWPRLHTILHPASKVFLLGNKMDLLPMDSPGCLEDLLYLLRESVISSAGLKREQIESVSLVSAKTGFGIESFINKLFHTWQSKGNIYLVGCTNVGKSSVFNSLIHSDYCAAPIQDMLQLATVSSWPGTTLNLLKFPVQFLNSAGKKQRMDRLDEEQKLLEVERRAKGELFRLNNNIRYATLKGIVGKTEGLQSVKSHKNRRRSLLEQGDEESVWCHDTPGTVNSDQILDLLTIDELKSLKPDHIIEPRTFSLYPGQTVFVAGIGRVDLLSTSDISCTLFSSSQLPITICLTSLAPEVYQRLLETEAFVVPINDPERLKVWPELKCRHLSVEAIGTRESAADIVLSSAGWIAVTGDMNARLEFNVWSPLGRGIHLRTPAYLSKSVCYRGPRLAGTPMYKPGKKMYFMRDLPSMGAAVPRRLK